ncbi:hypothetical protein A500_03506 [Clostridium sartagoforme AAU1]|uniref:Uncharacterized protein n=1 Tax=Clostridium sartagoforme AAU1 TaxID=1202534 RepID=R9CEA2_9CLOT|nr:hypothetical protein [Clostridium sartagoforme]EOR27632.1 hypothetical protein A500_03506 [Clostridium sartagoforme AAU1]
MLKLQPIEFILRTLPEGFLVIFAIYIFSRTNMNKIKYLITSTAFSLIVYFTRMLPINYGVHMILSVLILLFIIIYYNKIEVVAGIKSIILIYLIQLISELLNVLILNIFKFNLDVLLIDPVYKTILGIPSLIITGIIVLMFYMLSKKKKRAV